MLRGLPAVEIQQKIANWKVESLTFSVSKELAPEDAFIASYGDFESDHFVVGRLLRRALWRLTQKKLFLLLANHFFLAASFIFLMHSKISAGIIYFFDAAIKK